ncbi:Kinase, AGC PDK1 [Spironucleus salmonicida]|uniref:non-specific serine/threonine protein kinase n=1 Tax=Spironucleus salmonicida TaxID=348837 RepID=V6LM57_9EUKA|nr:Kinase, AGC PDK1 [Spironucleus salmonicida]|eukprot:EST41794.1 Kinase, AGC PDK1 [Spironucleus salmonicida]
MQIPGLSGSEQSIELDKYRIHEEIGSGAFGVIYRATKITDGQEVAMKIINTQLLKTESDKNSLQAEVNAFIYFRDLHFVIKALNRFTYEQYQIIVMEFAPMDLSQIIKTYNKLPPKYIQIIIAQIVEGFCQIHNAGFSHRDVKPQNILINRNGHVRISDFGTIKKMPDDEFEMSKGLEPFVRRRTRLSSGRQSNLQTPRQTQAQSFVGTQQYQAPEIQNAKAYYSSPTDIYGIGLISFELASGLPYFALKDNAEKYFDAMPENLRNFTLKCLEKNPYSRFQGGWKMLKEFEYFQGINFDKLEQFQLVNVLEIKKDIMQAQRTNMKLNKQFNISDHKIVLKTAQLKKFLLLQENCIYYLQAQVEYNGSQQQSHLLITDFHRMILINQNSNVYFEEFIIIQWVSYEQKTGYFQFQLKDAIIKIYTSQQNQDKLKEFIIQKFKPYNRAYCTWCKELTVKDLLCSKCGATERHHGQLVFFSPTTAQLPPSGQFSVDIINKIPEKQIIDTGRLLRCQNALRVNFQPQKLLSKSAIALALNRMNQLKTQLFFPSISQLQRQVNSYPLPKIIALFGVDENLTKVSPDTAKFIRVLRYSVCKYGYCIGFGLDERCDPAVAVDEEVLTAERIDFKVDWSAFE